MRNGPSLRPRPQAPSQQQAETAAQCPLFLSGPFGSPSPPDFPSAPDIKPHKLLLLTNTFALNNNKKFRQITSVHRYNKFSPFPYF